MLLDLLLVILGFSLIIFLHELGHFVAARWAGIRVLAFAMGFGPAIVSWRQGLGFRAGTSDREYAERLKAGTAAGLSPTEYRWNALPLGGYVKMLGQDDSDPSARSDAPDSFQSCVPWKRLIVISAGVVMNVITAAVLFVIVFSAGLVTEPAHVGSVAPGSPAARAIATNAQNLGITTPGLQPGDEVISIDDEVPLSFKDVAIAVAMAAKGEPLPVTVRRPGLAEPVRFSIVPEPSPGTRLLSLGVEAAASLTLPSGRTEAMNQQIADGLKTFGLGGVAPGSELASINGVPAASVYDIAAAAKASTGQPLTLAFKQPSGQTVESVLVPRAELDSRTFLVPSPSGGTSELRLEHVLGFVPVLKVERTEDTSRAGLKEGDVFVRLGDVLWPSVVEGIAEVRRNAGKVIPIVVLRDGREVELKDARVSSEGRLGFVPTSSADDSTMLARWPEAGRFASPQRDQAIASTVPAGAALGLPGGASITRVGDRQVKTFADLREALRQSALSREVRLAVSLPATAASAASSTEVTLALSKSDVESLTKLSWTSPIPAELFKPREITLRATSVGSAIGMGLHETRRVMLQTYVTFARLFQGSVKVEHLKGPVGIASAGVQLADRGMIWLLFFMAVISINLAVVNFLPLPIVDGGHAVFILYEQLTGRPVSVAVQNVAALAGLALIGSMFLIVTYNDIANLLWR